MPQGQFPTINAGTTYTASLIQSIVPPAGFKSADTSRASTTTMTADPDLTMPLVANGWYTFELWLNYEGGTEGSSDMQFTWSVPAGATLRGSADYVNNAGTTIVEVYFTASTTLQPGTNGSGAIRGVTARGSVQMSTTAGNLTFKWAQNTSSATPTIVHSGSYLKTTRLT